MDKVVRRVSSKDPRIVLRAQDLLGEFDNNYEFQGTKLFVVEFALRVSPG